MSRPARVLMLQGTSSSVGKSLLVTALCRILRQDGYSVAPFKAQNMALNAGVTADGLEMGRAQIVQAEAAGIEPTIDMNPILLKPEGNLRSQVIVQGRPAGHLSGLDYLTQRNQLWGVVAESLDRLRAQYEVVIIEGAGSPAEINLRAGDIVNMRVAEYADAPVLLVGDIDRGGVFAALVGTLALLEPAEVARIKGFLINKFRGHRALLDPGLRMLEARTAVPVLGVVPYLDDLRIADEDSVSIERQALRDRKPPPRQAAAPASPGGEGQPEGPGEEHLLPLPSGEIARLADEESAHLSHRERSPEGRVRGLHSPLRPGEVGRRPGERVARAAGCHSEQPTPAPSAGSGQAPTRPLPNPPPVGEGDVPATPVGEGQALSAQPRARRAQPSIDVAVVRLPHIANFDDFDLLAAEAGVLLRYVFDAGELGSPDIVIVPGSKATLADLGWLRSRGLADRIVQLAQRGSPVLGICGGYQMLGTAVEDPDGVEGVPGTEPGLGLLPVRTVLTSEKRTVRVQVEAGPVSGPFAAARGNAGRGYEIHAGRTFRDLSARRTGGPREQGERVFTITAPGEPPRPDGYQSPDGLIAGTYVHGIFENAAFRRALVEWLAERAGVSAGPAIDLDRDGEYERLAAAVRAAIDLDHIYRVIDLTR